MPPRKGEEVGFVRVTPTDDGLFRWHARSRGGRKMAESAGEFGAPEDAVVDAQREFGKKVRIEFKPQ